MMIKHEAIRRLLYAITGESVPESVEGMQLALRVMNEVTQISPLKRRKQVDRLVIALAYTYDDGWDDGREQLLKINHTYNAIVDSLPLDPFDTETGLRELRANDFDPPFNVVHKQMLKPFKIGGSIMFAGCYKWIEYNARPMPPFAVRRHIDGIDLEPLCKVYNRVYHVGWRDGLCV